MTKVHSVILTGITGPLERDRWRRRHFFSGFFVRLRIFGRPGQRRAHFRGDLASSYGIAPLPCALDFEGKMLDFLRNRSLGSPPLARQPTVLARTTPVFRLWIKHTLEMLSGRTMKGWTARRFRS